LSESKEVLSLEPVLRSVRQLSVAVDLPSLKSEARREIRTADWERLKRRCNQITSPPQWLTVTYSLLFGISASAALSIIPIAYAQGLPTFSLPLYTVGTIATAVLGGVLVGVKPLAA